MTLAELNEEFAALDRDRAESHRKLDAIGAANKWLRTTMAKALGRPVGDRDVALIVGPVFDNPGSGRYWRAYLYTAEHPDTPRTRFAPTTPEWSGTDWFTALTSAVWDLVDDDLLDLVMRTGRAEWFKFERRDGTEVRERRSDRSETIQGELED